MQSTDKESRLDGEPVEPARGFTASTARALPRVMMPVVAMVTVMTMVPMMAIVPVVAVVRFLDEACVAAVDTSLNSSALTRPAPRKR